MRSLWLALALGACAVDPETETTSAAVTTCALHSCEPSVGGHAMFSDTDFTTITDDFGNRRSFFVHIPARYDTLGTNEKMPLIFAFHGGGENRQAMIDGKWDAYFEQDYAFVFPLGSPDPCERGPLQWLSPGLAERAPGVVAPCTAATEVTDPVAGRMTYWRASNPDSFSDVRFVEALRAAVLARFQNLNPNKVYATGFSAGGGMSLTLACYRSSLFRSFSAVAKELGTTTARGDWNGDAVADIDPDSLVGTCGRTDAMSGFATGITAPELWGTGYVRIATPVGPIVLLGTAVKPVALFFGQNDIDTKVPAIIVSEPDYTTDIVRGHNNLNATYTYQNNYVNAPIGTDGADTQRRTYTGPSGSFSSAALRRLRTTSTTATEARHAVPDVDRCTSSTTAPIDTCDFNYTDETIAFWQNQADLNLVP